MALVIDCAQVDPTWGCRHRIRAASEAEALRLAALHARAHGTEPTPELLARSRASLRDEGAALPAGTRVVLAALDIEQLRSRVAQGLTCPGCGLLYFADSDAALAAAQVQAHLLEAKARLYTQCPDHAYRLLIGA